MKKNTYDAYFTVEAAFIIPSAFLLIILILQYGFFCYENSVSVQCCYLAALRASNKWDMSEGELEKYAEGEADKLLEERNLRPIKKECRAYVTFAEIAVETKAQMEVLFAEERGDLVNSWDFNTRKSIGRTIPTTYIRKYHMLKNIGDENNGSNK